MLLSLAQLLLTCLYFFRQSLHKARQDSDRTTASLTFSNEAAPVLKYPAVPQTMSATCYKNMLALLQLGLTCMSTCDGIGSIKHEVFCNRHADCLWVMHAETHISCRYDKRDAEACMKELMADVYHWDHSFTTPLQAYTAAHKNTTYRPCVTQS